MKTFSFVCLLGMSLAAPMGVHAAPSASTSSAKACTSNAALPGASSFTVGALHVRQYGDQGRPMILIPGLGSGAWVWNGTVDQLRHDHVVYTVTLAGFAGTSAPKSTDHYMDQVEASLLELIKEHHIDHPVLVGHSLGGTLAIRFAEKHNDLLSGVVAVDGLPVFPGTQSMTSAQRKAQAQAMKARLSGMDADQFLAQQTRYMQVMGVRDGDLAKRCGKLQAKSNPQVVAAAMAEDMAADDRAGLKHIRVPLLEISPYNKPDFEQAHERGAPMISEADKTALYQKILSNDPNAKVVSISPSRHFVMLDQPRKFMQVLKGFLKRLPNGEQQ